MTISDIIEDRRIAEVLHFTTNTGLLGMLASGGILSRARLPKEKYLEHVYRPNAEIRRDPEWFDYVSLSISRLNWEFFGHASRWHRDRHVWWCAISLDPVILTHDGVVFATTNNMYSEVHHGTGPEGLEALFAPRVTRWGTNVAKRPADYPRHLTTCHQAEVLYPRCVPSEYFRELYVATGEHADIVGTHLEMLLVPDADLRGSPELPVQVRPEAFER